MKTLATTTALALAAVLTVAAAGPATAAHPQPLLLNPPVGPSLNHLPRFGFNSYNISGIGEQVTYVRWGGIASQLGLQPGDTILRMNNFPLSYHGSWRDALRQAMYNGGYVQLAIRDRNTGYVAYRQTFLGTPGLGPVTPKAQLVGYGPSYNDDVCHNHGGGYVGQPGPITSKSVIGPQQNYNNSPQTNKSLQNLQNFVQLFNKKKS